MKRLRQVHLHVAIAGLAALAIACGSAAPEGGGVIEIDGSSTVFPVTEAVAEEFQRANPGARVTVGESGTGGGFQKFCRAETAISDASRPIRQSEMDVCTANGVTYVEPDGGGQRGQHLGAFDDRGRAEDALGTGRAGTGHPLEPGPAGMA
jgi:phosphate transport system substrate-binding protein